MAGGKETPRQKMIGMMYLVLTALLAMNISKDVLDAFKLVNAGLEKTKVTLLGKSNTTLADLDSKAATNPQKAGPFKAKAQDVDQRANDIVDYIEEMKARVMAASHKGNADGEGYQEYMENGKAIDMNDERIKKPDENQNNTTLLIGAKPEDPRTDPYSAAELRGKLEQYRDFMKSITVKEFTGATWNVPEHIKAGLDNTFSFEKTIEDEKEVVWETKNFFHIPLAAVITNLTKLQVDVENAKADMLSSLIAGIEGKSYKFTNLQPLVVPQSNYVLRGDTFRANVLLAAYDASNAPDIFIDNTQFDGQDSSAYVKQAGDEPIEIGTDGLGKLKIATSSLGLGNKSFKGVIEYVGPSGETEPYPFIIPAFTVAEPALVVSPIKMNVFYRGLPNPVEVSVPGVPQDKLTVNVAGSGHRISKNSDGTYTVTPGSGTTAKISVSAEMPDGTTQRMPDKEFRVKPIPFPIPKFAGKSPTDKTVAKGDLAVAPGVRAEMENFDFEVDVKVTKFKLVVIRGGDVIEVPSNSNRVTADMKGLLSSVARGQKIYIEDIEVKMPDGSNKPIPSSLSLRVQ